MEDKKQVLKIVTYSSSELSKLPEEILRAIAHCYAVVFNESWGETWTEDLSLNEVSKAFSEKDGREPIATIIWNDKKAVGFGWGLLTDADHLIAERDMPFDLPAELKKEGLEKTKLFLQEVAKTSGLFLYRDFGVLAAYQGRLAGPLTQEILHRVKDRGRKILIQWTSTDSPVYAIGIGLNWMPFHYFSPKFSGKTLLLMAGSVKWTSDFVDKYIDDMDEGYKQMAERFAIYSCKK